MLEARILTIKMRTCSNYLGKNNYSMRTICLYTVHVTLVSFEKMLFNYQSKILVQYLSNKYFYFSYHKRPYLQKVMSAAMPSQFVSL